ncbi:MAG: hypothetical protein K5839_00650 [Treponemataceae bacterium]|nr:hypothetical protein [Treponemataceae bacterium]
MKRKFKTWLGFLLILMSLLCFSCDEPEEEGLTDYAISEIYGYTYYGNITASSGNTLIPSLILYNENRVDWNMNVNGMSTNQFYYFSEKNSTSNYTMYWYSAEDESSCVNKVKDDAAMVVQLGINSLDEVVVLLTGDNLTDVDGMTNTRVPMTRQSSIAKNTTPPDIVYDEDVQDVTITIPEDAESCDWFEDYSEYEGTFVYLVGGGKLGKGQGQCDEFDSEIPVSTVTKTGSNTVSVTTPDMYYSASMIVNSYEIPDVSVLKSGDVYYLYKESYSVQVPQNNGSVITLTGDEVFGKYEDGIFILRVSFYPGKMPYPVTQIFTSDGE